MKDANLAKMREGRCVVVGCENASAVGSIFCDPVRCMTYPEEWYGLSDEQQLHKP